MSTDYSTFRTMVGNLPNIVTATRYDPKVSELVTSILEAFGYPSVADLPTDFRKIVQEVKDTHAKLTSIAYVGIEVELENFRVSDDPEYMTQCKQQVFWQQKEDGSLRNNGIEMVSRFGLTTAHVPEAINTLEKYVTTVTRNRVEANARTGLHVHLDVSRMTRYEFANFLFLYSMFEPLIFHVSGGRSNNIFCVPWETNRQTLGYIVHNLMTNLQWERNWRWRNYSKYCGLNLASMSTFGTVEFRMHKGTYKAQEIQKWVDFIEAMFLYAKKTDFVSNLNRFRTMRHDHKYWDVIEDVFKPYLKEIVDLPAGKRAELIARCKYATVSFFKHFVDHSKLPENNLNKNYNRQAAVYRYQPVDLEVEDMPPQAEGLWNLAPMPEMPEIRVEGGDFVEDRRRREDELNAAMERYRIHVAGRADAHGRNR